MSKIHSVSELLETREYHKKLLYPVEISVQSIVIRVGMSTCGIASGAKEIKKVLEEECEYLAVEAQIKQTGCLGYCYAEPMVEVIMPGIESKIFGYVDKHRAKEIIEKYILRGETVEGEINVSYRTIYD